MLFATTMRRQIDARIEATLVAEARLAGGSARPRRAADVGAASSTSEADRLGALLGARVTFIAAGRPRRRRLRRDAGRRRGDGEPRDSGPRCVEAARARASGASRRYSATLKSTCCTSRVPVRHPAIAFVRVALPLTDIRHQLQTVLTATLTALGVGAARRRARSPGCSPRASASACG